LLLGEEEDNDDEDDDDEDDNEEVAANQPSAAAGTLPYACNRFLHSSSLSVGPTIARSSATSSADIVRLSKVSLFLSLF